MSRRADAAACDVLHHARQYTAPRPSLPTPRLRETARPSPRQAGTSKETRAKNALCTPRSTHIHTPRQALCRMTLNVHTGGRFPRANTQKEENRPECGLQLMAEILSSQCFKSCSHKIAEQADHTRTRSGVAEIAELRSMRY